MTYFSLFSGVGGFELAINNVYVANHQKEAKRLRQTSEERIRIGETEREVSQDERLADSQSGMEQQPNRSSVGQPTCVGFSEIDKYAISVYQYHYPKHKNYGDITQIDWNTVPEFDLVVGGSPCQDLSVAGKQKGLSGERSGLFFEFVRCLKEKQPTNFIWENVKGALSSSNGWDFARVQIEFSEAGYDVEWQVLNAKDFGVPQNRERIFVVGHLRGKSRPKVFPIRTHSTNVIESGLATISATTGVRRVNISPTLDTMYHKGLGSKQARPCVINNPTHSNDRVYSDDGISPSLNTMHGGRRQPKILSDLIKEVLNDETPTALDLENNAIHKDRFMCLQEPHHNKHRLISNAKIRRLTPLECERLMSWPDDWTKEPNISDTQRYKRCGNGVVSKVVEAIIERLLSTQSQLSGSGDGVN